MEKKIYDVLILGGGVAGMTAAVYAKRAGKKVAIIEKFALGGQLSELGKIENFPSQAQIDGMTLAEMFRKQIKALEIEVIFDEIEDADIAGEMKVLNGKLGQYSAKSVIIATGMGYKSANIGEEKFLGKGVSYCAVCDGNFFKGKIVGVLSKKGSGYKDAKYLSSLAKQVIMFDSEDMSILAKNNSVKNIEIVSNAKVKSLVVDDVLKEIVLEKENVKLDGLFVCLGKKPGTSLFEGKLSLDKNGFVIVDEKMQSSVSGVYAVGDTRAGVLKQLVTACADGAIAGTMA